MMGPRLKRHIAAGIDGSQIHFAVLGAAGKCYRSREVAVHKSGVVNNKAWTTFARNALAAGLRTALLQRPHGSRRAKTRSSPWGS